MNAALKLVTSFADEAKKARLGAGLKHENENEGLEHHD